MTRLVSSRADADAAAPRVPSIFFSFDSAVVVGASADVARIGGATVSLLKKYGYAGRLYGLNPKYSEVQGIPCFASAEALPDGVEMAVFCVASEAVRELLPVLRRKGLKGAVVYSSGFGETGAAGRELQAWLRDYARAHGIAVLGPNCAGMVSFARGRALAFTTSLMERPPARPGRIALVSQSGGVATNIMADGLASGVRFSHVITTGNEADLTVSDFLSHLADDDDTDAVLGYIEGLDDGAAFCAAARRMQEAGKPLILMRAGLSEAGQAAAASHTGKMSSGGAGFDAAFERYGVIRARTFQELNDHARLFARPGIDPRVTVVSTSGGAGVYVADLCAELGIPLGSLGPETEAALAGIVPHYGRIRNPVDLTAQVVNDMSILERSMSLLLDDPGTGILLFLLSGKGTVEQSQSVIELFQALQARSRKLIAICWLGVDETVRLRAAQAGLMVCQEPARVLEPLRSYLAFHARAEAADERHGERPLAAPEAFPPAALQAAGRTGGMLSERACMKLLASLGVDCVRRQFARSEDEVAAIGAAMAYPCVMKVSEPVLAHKSDRGGVRTHIGGVDELRAAWRQMQAGLGATEVVIAEQVGPGTEILVGAMRDPAFGLRLTLGSGGIWVNVLNDAVTLIPPFTEAEIRRALTRLGVWQPLSGARGQRPGAVDELVATIAGIARFALAAMEHLAEFECNPIIVTDRRAVVVDAIGFAAGTPRPGGN